MFLQTQVKSREKKIVAWGNWLASQLCQKGGDFFYIMRFFLVRAHNRIQSVNNDTYDSK